MQHPPLPRKLLLLLRLLLLLLLLLLSLAARGGLVGDVGVEGSGGMSVLLVL